MIKFFWRQVRNFLIFSAAILLRANAVSAQNTSWILKSGNRFFNLENYRAAIPFYEMILDNDPDNATALYKAGVSYLAFDKEKASDYLYKAQRLKPGVAKDIEYWLGRVDHVNYRFEDAINHYQLYSNSLNNRNNQVREELTMLMEQSRNALKQVNKPKDLFVKNLGPEINTPYSDHSPVVSKDGKVLLFTTRSQTATHGQTASDGEYFEDIVETIRQEDNSWGKPRSLNTHLNSSGHDASIQLFDNDQKLLLYRQTENGDFYVSEREGNDWRLPKRLNSNINTNHYESDGFISPDGLTLYFATNHFSNGGDKDIYMARKTPKGDWGKPKSLGNTINTSFDEDSPFLSPDGKTMYFTSRGHFNMGGYDVFITHFDSVTQKWTKPENMGYPVNSPDDDTYFRLNADGTMAYLSSYRMGGYGEKDIWSIDLAKPVLVRGKVINEETGTALPEIEIVFTSKPADKKPVEYISTTQADSGTFTLELLSGRTYQVSFFQEGTEVGKQTFEVPAVNKDNVMVETDFKLKNKVNLRKQTATNSKSN